MSTIRPYDPLPEDALPFDSKEHLRREHARVLEEIGPRPAWICERHRWRGAEECAHCVTEAADLEMAQRHPPQVVVSRDRSMTPDEADSWSRWEQHTKTNAKPDSIRVGSRAEVIAEDLLLARTALAEAETGRPRLIYEGGYSHRRTMYEKPSARAARVRRLRANVEGLEAELCLAQQADLEGRASYLPEPPREVYRWENDEPERDPYAPGSQATENVEVESKGWRRWLRSE